VTRVDKSHLVFARKRPAMWKCSQCGQEYSIERRIRPQSAEERLSEIERDLRSTSSKTNRRQVTDEKS